MNLDASNIGIFLAKRSGNFRSLDAEPHQLVIPKDEIGHIDIGKLKTQSFQQGPTPTIAPFNSYVVLNVDVYGSGTGYTSLPPSPINVNMGFHIIGLESGETGTVNLQPGAYENLLTILENKIGRELMMTFCKTLEIFLTSATIGCVTDDMIPDVHCSIEGGKLAIKITDPGVWTHPNGSTFHHYYAVKEFVFSRTEIVSAPRYVSNVASDTVGYGSISPVGVPFWYGVMFGITEEFNRLAPFTFHAWPVYLGNTYYTFTSPPFTPIDLTTRRMFLHIYLSSFNNHGRVKLVSHTADVTQKSDEELFDVIPLNFTKNASDMSERGNAGFFPDQETSFLDIQSLTTTTGMYFEFFYKIEERGSGMETLIPCPWEDRWCFSIFYTIER